MTTTVRIHVLGDDRLCEEFSTAFSGRVTVLPGPEGIEGPDDIGAEFSVFDDGRKKENLRALDRALPFPGLLLTNVVALTLKEQSRWIQHPGRLLGIGLLPGMLRSGLIECVKADSLNEQAAQSLQRFLTSIATAAAFVGDVPGLVLPRIRAMILNEAFLALEEGVASTTDIDLAMRLGTNYPTGPFAWGDAVGLSSVVAILEALQRFYGDDRYLPAPLLREAALRVHCR